MGLRSSWYPTTEPAFSVEPLRCRWCWKGEEADLLEASSVVVREPMRGRKSESLDMIVWSWGVTSKKVV